jgi:hypothetical protein
VRHKLDPFDNSWWVIGRDQAVRNGLDAPEYTTAWNPATTADTSTAIAGMPELAYDVADGSARVTVWRARHIELAIDLKEPTLLRIRQFYFPNWRATVDGDVALSLSPDTDSGLLTVRAPAGHYALTLRLMPLQQEVIGGIASAAGLVLWSICWWWQRRLKKY